MIPATGRYAAFYSDPRAGDVFSVPVEAWNDFGNPLVVCPDSGDLVRPADARFPHGAEFVRIAQDAPPATG